MVFSEALRRGCDLRDAKTNEECGWNEGCRCLAPTISPTLSTLRMEATNGCVRYHIFVDAYLSAVIMAESFE